MPRPLLARYRVGLAAVVLTFVGITSLYALAQLPFEPPDETAHLGYAYEIADLRLPEIDRPPDVPASAVQWQAEIASREAARYKGVWVANHPPLSYVLEAPLVWVAELADRADGGVLYLRFANIAFAAAGLVLTYFLAAELTGGNRRIGLGAAALAALLPQGHIVFSHALNDGFAFAAGSAVIWAGLRVLRRGPTRRELALLAASCVVAAGARAATMLLAVVVVAYVAAHRWLAGPPAGRARAAATVLAVGLVPAAVAWGWFYVRNVVLYGDIGASDHLLRLFRRRPRGSVLKMMTRGQTWVRLYQLLLSPSTLRRRVPPLLTTATIVMGIGAVVAVVTGRCGDRNHDGSPSRISRAGAGLAVASLLLIALTVAQHVSGGGNAYPRYLFPALGVLATFAVIGVDRLAPRIGPLVLVTVVGWWAILQAQRFRVGVDPLRVRRPRDSRQPPPDILRVLPVGDGWRMASAVLIVAGLAGAAVVLLLGLLRPYHPRHDTQAR